MIALKLVAIWLLFNALYAVWKTPPLRSFRLPASMAVKPKHMD